MSKPFKKVAKLNKIAKKEITTNNVVKTTPVETEKKEVVKTSENSINGKFAFAVLGRLARRAVDKEGIEKPFFQAHKALEVARLQEVAKEFDLEVVENKGSVKAFNKDKKKVFNYSISAKTIIFDLENGL